MFCLANCCRLCLSNDSTVVEYNYLASNNVSYFNKLISIVPELGLDTEIYYPTGICKQCQKRIDQFDNFIEECIKSKKMLTTYINQLEHSTNNKITPQSTNNFKIEEQTFTEIPIPASTTKTIFIKEEIDIEESPVLGIPVGTCIKQEEIELNEAMHNTDDSTTSNEFEPIRKNEKTPRLKRYKCSNCPKKFSRQSHLLRHFRVHTGDRPYACTKCNKSFTLLENLERHQLIHSDIKPYTCTQCDKSFHDKSYLKQHIQLHEGLRYICDVCKKSFAKSCRLMVHKRKHTGERPFECNMCKITYADPDTLRKHRKKCEINSSKNVVAYPENLSFIKKVK